MRISIDDLEMIVDCFKQKGMMDILIEASAPQWDRNRIEIITFRSDWKNETLLQGRIKANKRAEIELVKRWVDET